MPEVFGNYDAADYLKTEADITAFLEASAESDDPAVMAAALSAIARAHRLRKPAK